ncbi:MAG: glutamine amidotransferase, partial [Eubacteriales bacterium]|nr:glutamine amidotransferase [Eubacteriales bacterium]
MTTLDICHLYPDLLNLYGDMGNIITLAQRARWRGINAAVHNVTLGEPFDSEKYDIIFLGGGQDYEQEIIHADLISQKRSEIINAVENNRVFLCVCGGYQLMGKYYKTWDGKEIEFLGALNIWTIGGKERMIGNIALNYIGHAPDGYKKSFTVAGFENHSGRTYLGEGVSPFGKVIRGFGNNGEDGLEGANYKNVICSYLHGSLLPKNPLLADLLLLTAISNRYPSFGELAF